MIATNLVPEGMKNDATSAALGAVAEAVEWRHAWELEGYKRPGQRVVIYPPMLDKLGAVPSTGDISLDSDDGHDIAYQRILAAGATFTNPPGFFSSDSRDLGGLEIADKVPVWILRPNKSQLDAGNK